MITFDRKEKQVVLEVSCFIPFWNDRVFSFYWNCEDEVYAGLLAYRFSREFERAVRTAREEAYNDGWKDAKAKRIRKTWWGGVLS